MGTGQWQRQKEPLHEWAVIGMPATHSLNFLKIVITASSPQGFHKTCNSLQKQLTKAHQVNTLYQHLSSQRQQPENLWTPPSLTNAKNRLEIWKGYFWNCKNKTRFIRKSGKERNPGAPPWGWWGSSSGHKDLKKGAKEELVKCPSAE